MALRMACFRITSRKREALQHGGADIGPGHHLDHRGAHHAHDVAEVVEHHHRHRQDELGGDRPAAARDRAARCRAAARARSRRSRQEHARGEFRHRGRDDAGDRDGAVELSSPRACRRHAEHDRERHDDREGDAGQQQVLPQPVPDDVVDRHACRASNSRNRRERICPAIRRSARTPAG